VKTRARSAVLSAALAAACAGGTPAPAPTPAATAATGGGLDSAAAAVAVPAPAGAAWVDPEPPDAQAIAEANVGAAWNADKVTRLEMSITTLVDNTTGLVGARTSTVAAATTVDERLTRLGAQTTGTEVTIRLPGSVLFDFDSAQIRPDAERTLTEVAEVLKAYGQRPMRIEGHTDSVASDDYNQKLSERRAQSVQAWLASRGGVKAALATKGWGEAKPAATNDTASGRQLNRRVEVIIDKGR
jgi:outer membrane protein OmpA-like peptidoglycan-associated protein